MQLLDGKMVSARIVEELRTETDRLKAAGKRPPHLAAVLVGEEGASQTYVAAKIRACAAAGFESSLLQLPVTVPSADLVREIQTLNADPQVDGILVQLPLPGHIDPAAIVFSIRPEKDVDGFHPLNLGRMVAGLPGYTPATPYGLLLLMAHYQIQTTGRHAVVVGRSAIVGTPVSILLSRKAYPGNCTVTLCHSHTPDLGGICRQADILIAATGKPGSIRGSMVKEGAVVLDVGTTRVMDPSRKSGYRLLGDVDFDEVAPKCSFITPVPGGVGPMTIAGLLKNTLLAATSRESEPSGSLPLKSTR
ncbi:MAG TPA: tetrahydrofolate dehydrogenase/cyclohydrolase catalytic domain-containing protein [Chitinophagaceae bacterium]|nr:tetrahydrofolate dehydrogenase/cyclohydrolase catalytic domain-containing protein [Chitinophagaceae bacterium]